MVSGEFFYYQINFLFQIQLVFHLPLTTHHSPLTAKSISPLIRTIFIPGSTVVRHAKTGLSFAPPSSQIWQLAQSPFQQNSPIEMVSIKRYWKHLSRVLFSGTSTRAPRISIVTRFSKGSKISVSIIIYQLSSIAAAAVKFCLPTVYC